MFLLSKLTTIITDKDPENYTLTEHLLYYDGPLLSIANDGDGNTFIYMFLDMEDEQVRFCYISISNEILSDLLAKRITLQNMIFTAEQILFFDLIGENETICYLLSDSTLFPQEYLPDADAYL
jgi:hypothetical protein